MAGAREPMRMFMRYAPGLTSPIVWRVREIQTLPEPLTPYDRLSITFYTVGTTHRILYELVRTVDY